MTTDAEHPTERVQVDEVYEFWAGAAALGLSLGSLVQYARGETPLVPRFFPVWTWLVGVAFFVISALRAKSTAARRADVLMAILLLCGAAVARMPNSSIVLVGQSLCLATWGAVAIQQSGRRMPESLGRAGLGLAIAACSAGFLPGLWKWVSLAAVIIVVLVSIWMLDNLEADGVVVGRKRRTSEETRAAQQGDEADKA